MAQSDIGVIRNRMTAVRQSFPELRAVLLAKVLRYAMLCGSRYARIK
jgi:hypothetical protein